MIEFRCEGCGALVLDAARETIPASHLCAMCDWLCEFVRDPDEFWQAYQRTMGTRRAMLADKDVS